MKMISALDEERVNWLLDLLQDVSKQERMPYEWRTSMLVPVYKQKSDILECGNNRGIELTEHVIKVQGRIIDQRP